MVLLRRALILSISLLLSGCPSLDDFDLLSNDKNKKDEAQSKPKDSKSNAAGVRPGGFQSAVLNVGDRFTFDNPNMTWEIVKIAKGRIEWRGDDDEKHVTGTNPILPALEWSGSKGGTGRRLIRDKSGSLVPMLVGAKTTFRSTVTSDRPPFGWENIWTCAVQAKEVVLWRGRPLDTFVVGCGRKRTNELTFNYAPEIGHYVTQRTFQGAGKPELLRQLISVDYAKDRNVRPVAKTPLKVTAPIKEKAAIVRVAPKPKKQIARSAPAPRKPKIAAVVQKSPRPASRGPDDIQQLMDSVIVKTPDFAENATAAGPDRPFVPQPQKPAEAPDSAKIPIKLKSKFTPPPDVPSIQSVPSPKSVPAPLAVAKRKTVPPVKRTTPPLARKISPPVPKPAVSVRKSLAVPPPPPPPSPKVAPAATPKVASAAGLSGVKNHGVHFASYRTRERALLGWDILRKQSKGALNDQAPLVQKVHIKGKGDFFRLYIGALMKRGEAVRFCNSLKKQKIPCNVANLG